MRVEANSGSGGGGGVLFETSVTTQTAHGGINTGIKATDATYVSGWLRTNPYGGYGAYAFIDNGAIDATRQTSHSASITINSSGELVFKWNSTTTAFNNLIMDIVVC